LIWCHFARSRTYEANWRFFVTMRDDNAMKGRGMVLTTTNRQRLDDIVGEDSNALEVVGIPKDLQDFCCDQGGDAEGPSRQAAVV
jgi:hypothetical protein